MKAVKWKEFERRGSSKELIIMLHSYMSSPRSMAAVRQVVESEFPDADLYAPKLPASRSSTAKPVSIVQGLLNEIDQLCDLSTKSSHYTEYDKIILIGHSLGALIARKIYVCACGEIPGAPIEEEITATEPRPWAKKVERIILLAGMNRGWRISHHLSLVNAVIWTTGSLWGNLLGFIKRNPPLIFTIRKGAPFITQLRIHWIHMRNHAQERKVGNALSHPLVL